MSDNKPRQSTPAATLREQIMDSRIPKAEREWWAARTIEGLERELAEARKEIWNTISAMADLCAENVELKKDSARLDWLLQETGPQGFRARVLMVEDVWYAGGHVRPAIDAAMAEPK